MKQPNFQEVPAEDLAPCMVYVRDDGEQMIVLEAGENAEADGPGEPSLFVVGRSLLNAELEHSFAVSRRETFKVVIDGKSAIRDAGDQLDQMIGRATANLRLLGESDPARAEREEQLSRDTDHREWLAEQARQCGVRLRAS